jgi:hypothetical protein
VNGFHGGELSAFSEDCLGSLRDKFHALNHAKKKQEANMKSNGHSSHLNRGNAFEIDTLLAITRDCVLPAPRSLTSHAMNQPISIAQIKHVRSFNQCEKMTLETEMSTLLGALVRAQQSYLSLALAHIDAEQRILEDFQTAWSSHLLQMSDAVQLSLQRGPLSRARG